MDEQFYGVLNARLASLQSDDRFAYADHVEKVSQWRNGHWLSPAIGKMVSGVFPDSSWDVEKYFPDWLFAKLTKLETLLGKPQYVEFAFREAGAEPEATLLQIADVNEKIDFYEFPETVNPFIRGNMVVGTGTTICQKAVYVSNPDDVALLSGFNQANKGYLVIYEGRLTSRMLGAPLEYADISNASALVELSEPSHFKHPKAHFEGMLEASGKLFIATRAVDWELLDSLKAEIRRRSGKMGIIDATFRVTASERQQKGIVEIVEKSVGV
jgi:hypothetical protein